MPIYPIHHTRPDRRGAVSPRIAGAIAAAAVIVLFLTGLVPRLAARRVIDAEVNERNGQAPVFVATARQGAPTTILVLPGTVQALHEAQLYARTSGYVKRWYVDIGTHVKAGQLLAEIESPEVTQEYLQAEATAAQNRANTALAQTSLTRWQSLEKDSAVSKQELDERAAAYDAAAASENAAKANVRRLAELRGFTRLTAPFAGVVTVRGVDVGALVQPGVAAQAPTNGSVKGLFAVAQTDTVRVYVNVPEPYAPSVRVGGTASVTLGSLPGRAFKGKVVRTAQAVDPSSRTLLAELAIPNKDGALLPGSSAIVNFTLDRAAPPVIVPANTLQVGTKGTRVAIVAADTVAYSDVQLGRDYGDSVEVFSGVAAGQTLVVNPGDDLLTGMRVKTAPVPKREK